MTDPLVDDANGSTQQENATTIAHIATADSQSSVNDSTLAEDDEDEIIYCICRRPDDGRFMICCEVCQEWFHGQCVGVDERSAAEYVEFHCKQCESKAGPSKLRASRKSQRVKSNIIDYSDDLLASSGGRVGGGQQIVDLLNSREFHCESFKRLIGEDFDLQLLEQRGFSEPVIFERSKGLDIRMPPSSISVPEIAKIIGDRPVEIVNSANQEPMPGWTLFQWANYFDTPPAERKQVLNVISLEISDTALAQQIQRPAIVRQLDWIDKCWPQGDTTLPPPKVQLYCLMSPRGCWTDFHIDFGGTSVFYHILSGKKLFYMIPPTKRNLEKYERWCRSDQQSTTFFPDVAAGPCYLVELYAGQTMFIPSGWIHAVFTPRDSVVIGGNFLHGFSIAMQLSIYDLERRVNVPAVYRFPYFERLQWFSAEYYLNLMKNDPSKLSDRVMDGLESLADYLFKRLVVSANSGFLSKTNNGTSQPSQINAKISDEERRFIRESLPPHLKGKKAKQMIVEFSNVIADCKLERTKSIPVIGPPTPWQINTERMDQHKQLLPSVDLQNDKKAPAKRKLDVKEDAAVVRDSANEFPIK